MDITGYALIVGGGKLSFSSRLQSLKLNTHIYQGAASGEHVQLGLHATVLPASSLLT
jgi:hypothetical protein